MSSVFYLKPRPFSIFASWRFGVGDIGEDVHDCSVG